MSAVEKNIMKPKGSMQKREPKEYEERVIEVARVSRVVKGGRRIRFRALVVLGNRKGAVGMGVAKANEVADAVRKASTYARKHLVHVPIVNGTIPHEVTVKHGGAVVMLKPASSGTSIVAGGSIRQIAELSGISDLLTKSLGSSNKINIVTATLKALGSFVPSVVEQVKAYAEKPSPAAVTKGTPEAKKAESEAKAGEKPAKKVAPKKELKVEAADTKKSKETRAKVNKKDK